MTYFRDNYEHVRLPFADGVNGLRNAQIGAVHALAAHFASRKDAAIVTMPTGTGKTAVLMLAPYFARALRVLVVTPSRPVRGQIAESFENQELLRRLRCLPAIGNPPRVHEVENRLSDQQAWEDLRRFDIVVATPFTTSPEAHNVAQPPGDLFDLLLIDEAHHSAATTWSGIFAAFPNAHRALFTATPFREDRREIKGRFVYTYTVKQAKADGVFGDIRFIAVEPQDGQSHDEAVAVRTAEQFRQDRENGFQHYVMVRTDSKARATELQEVYATKTTLRTAVVHSDHTYSRIKSVIADLRRGVLDGIICVDMFGEGFDFPNLKIAAIHAPHRSLAVTLQFIGRFARVAGQNLGTATFVAVPMDIEVERQRLYNDPAGWQELVLNLGAGRVQQEEQIREALDTFEEMHTTEEDVQGVSIFALEPKRHVKIYRCEGITLDSAITLPVPFSLIREDFSHELTTRVLLMRTTMKPQWITSTGFETEEHDLAVVHHHADSGLLFIGSSKRNDTLYETIASQLATSYRPLALPEVNRVLAGVQRSEFFNIGMRSNADGALKESYRILTGPNPQDVVTELDGQLYHRGHLFGRCVFNGEDSLLGFSSSGKVWSPGQCRIPEFIDWCGVLATRIAGTTPVTTGSKLDLLSAGELVTRVPNRVIGIDWPMSVYDGTHEIIMTDGQGRRVHRPLLDCDLAPRYRPDGTLEVVLALDEHTVVALFDPARTPAFETVGNWNETVLIEKARERTRYIDWLNANGLPMILQDGSTLRGRHYVPRRGQAILFDMTRVVVPDWTATRVDIKNECGPSTGALRSIQEGLRDIISQLAPIAAVCDHGTGEVADFVVLLDSPTHLIVRVYHCKALARNSTGPGGRVEDLYEVCGQAMKGIRWLKNPELLCERIRARVQTQGHRQFFVATFRAFDDSIRNRQKPIQMEVAIVQPGLSRQTGEEGVRLLLASVDDYIKRAVGAPLAVLGSN